MAAWNVTRNDLCMTDSCSHGFAFVHDKSFRKTQGNFINEPVDAKAKNLTLHPAQTQIILGICPG